MAQAAFKSVEDVQWRRYGLQCVDGSLQREEGECGGRGATAQSLRSVVVWCAGAWRHDPFTSFRKLATNKMLKVDVCHTTLEDSHSLKAEGATRAARGGENIKAVVIRSPSQEGRHVKSQT
ncbi:hypothetical protein O3P69_011352 [Scylla paramamosain]|uniref:Uncharacterized protein n=1 Tax=Scylla paramamosain TaxID=85552 RepID=A0AAW0T8R3_SCYPA